MTNNKNLLKFLEKISKDKDKILKLASYSNPEEMYNYALSESDGGFTKEEFMDTLKEISDISNQILLNAKKSGKSPEEIIKEMSDENLENVSGGIEEVHRSIVMGASAAVSLFGILFQMYNSYNQRKITENNEKKFNDLNEKQIKLKELQTQLGIEKAKEELRQLEQNQSTKA